ncbi:MAG: cysteine hydrolase [Acidobacteriota bacterium]|nr:cysteine hydrolase [Acidobacteriota bacterium]
MKTVFFDIDSQMDFVYPAGALYVRGAERVVGAIARLNRYAAARGIPVVSTMDAHEECDPEFALWPHHCVAGTLGQRKPESTLLERRVVVPNRACGAAIDGAQQILLEKQHVDMFTAVNLARVLAELGAEECVVYGVVTEVCVRHAALGLLGSGRRVTVVADAIECLDAAAGGRAIEELAAAGGRLARVAEIAG